MKYVRTRSAFTVLVLSTAICAVPNPSSASPVPLATWDAVVDNSSNLLRPSIGSGVQTSSGTVSNTTTDVSSSVTGTLSPGTNGSVSASASAAYNSGDSSAYVAALNLYFQIINIGGVTGVTSVPVIIGGQGMVTQTVQTNNDVWLGIQNEAVGGLQVIASACSEVHAGTCSNSGYTLQSSFNVAETLSLSPNTSASNSYYDLVGSLYISANGDFIPSGTTDSQSGYLDPYVIIDPTFADASDFEILFSSNVGNFAATPLPAALPLFAGGLGFLGFVAGHRKRKAQTVV